MALAKRLVLGLVLCVLLGAGDSVGRHPDPSRLSPPPVEKQYEFSKEPLTPQRCKLNVMSDFCSEHNLYDI